MLLCPFRAYALCSFIAVRGYGTVTENSLADISDIFRIFFIYIFKIIISSSEFF